MDALPVLLLRWRSGAPLAFTGLVNLATGGGPSYEKECLPAPKTGDWRMWCELAKPRAKPSDDVKP